MVKRSGAAFRAVSYLWLGSILGAGCAFLTQIVLARKLGPEKYGIFASSLSMIMLISPLAGFGIAQYWLKIFGQEGWRAMRWLQGSFKFIFLSTISVILIIIIWSMIGPHDKLTAIILIMLSMHVLGQVSIELVSVKFQLEENYMNLSFFQVLPHAIRLIFIVSLSYFSTSFNFIKLSAYSYVFVSLLFFIFSSFLLFRMYKGIFLLKGHSIHSFHDEQIKYIIPNIFNVVKQSWPFGVAALFHLIYFQSDIILLKYMKNAEIAGIYNVAFTVMLAVYMLPSVIYQKFLLPKMHRWAHQDRKFFYRVYRQGNLAMLFLGVIAMVSIWLLAPWGVVFLFSETYQEATNLLMVLSVSAPIIFVASSVGATLVTQEHMMIKVKCMGVVAGVNIFLNILLIPIYGALGAAIATIFSNCILLSIYYYFAEKVVFLSDRN
ncbi:MAG: oligosaccharide flippase family protein [Desulfuromonadaceae bacterium]|nr:oligosaccharide flippase family protein [Desulfuromonadaceae bacterium]